MNDYQIAFEIMSSLADDAAGSMQHFNRDHYADAFQKFYEKCLPAFDSIETLYGQVKEPDEMIANMASTYLEGAAKFLSGAKKTQRDARQMQLNMQLAVYVYPAILHYRGESSQALAETIQKLWKQNFPKANVSMADFETIQAGFRKRFCYITTAVCQSTGGGDDCYELTLLRNYRDNYLYSLEDGEQMIRRYYDVAPSIVKHIDERDDSTEIYSGIYDTWILPCIRMIENGRNEECRETYEGMVETLREQYFFREQ